MPGRSRATTFPITLYATPNVLYQEIFYTVLRAGHLIAAPGYGVHREHFPGHELIYSLAGRGSVSVSGATHDVHPGDLVWFNCQHPHRHLADPVDPWEVFWIRVDGLRLDRIAAMLGVDSAPVIRSVPRAEAELQFHGIFERMAQVDPDSAPVIHAHVARLVALACCARKLPPPSAGAPNAALQRVVEQMRREYFRPYTVAELAAQAGMSASHFARSFRKAFSTGPIDWLRRERINQAKRRLGETDDPIQWIAEQVGYRDRFYFSKDFKKMTGISPRAFRCRESSST